MIVSLVYSLLPFLKLFIYFDSLNLLWQISQKQYQCQSHYRQEKDEIHLTFDHLDRDKAKDSSYNCGKKHTEIGPCKHRTALRTDVFAPWQSQEKPAL